MLRSDVARCIYGFSDAPISATVSIESEDGTNVVSTESVTERDGLIRLSAYGFGFSSPTIKVKLSQDVINEDRQATTKVTTQVNKKLVCVKGKKERTFSAKKTQCPKGFKRVKTQ